MKVKIYKIDIDDNHFEIEKLQEKMNYDLRNVAPEQIYKITHEASGAGGGGGSLGRSCYGYHIITIFYDN